jgi:hypothetical protein
MNRLVIAAVALALAVSAAGAEDKVEPKVQTEKIKKLQKERRDLLKKALDLQMRRIENGTGSIRGAVPTSKELLRAELDVATTAKERLAAHEAHLELTKRAEKMAVKAHDAGGLTMFELTLVQADRREAEIGWLKAGGQDKKAKKDE